MKYLRIICLLLISNFVMAANLPTQSGELAKTKAKIQMAADEYFSQLKPNIQPQPFHSLMLNHFPHPPPPPQDCLPPVGSSSCTDVACEKLGWAGCNDLDEIKAVGNACRGNRDGECMKQACNLLGWAGCNDLEEIRSVGQACAGNFNSGCLTASCEKLGWAGCNDSSEISAVGAACKGVFGRDCIDQICQKVGSSNCNDIEEIVAVAEACGGAK